jgi:hypothetical protein
MFATQRWHRIALIAVVALALTGLSSCSSTSADKAPSVTPTTRKAALTVAPRPTDLPESCRGTPHLAAVASTPAWPSGFRILDAVPAALALQYPTVYGGTVAAPPTPGESAVDINSHLVVLETVRDPELEAEAKGAYPSGISVTFAETSRTQSCLSDLNSKVVSQWSSATKSGITIYSIGIAGGHLDVGVSACTAPAERAARRWFSQRWGGAVSVETCQMPAVSAVGHSG